MSLRTRLFLLIGALAAVLVVAQWWLVRTLSRDVAGEVREVAFHVGEGVVSSLGLTPQPEGTALVRRFELPIPVPPGAVADVGAGAATAAGAATSASTPGTKTVTEREIRLRETATGLEIVDQKVRVSRVGAPSPGTATPELGQAGELGHAGEVGSAGAVGAAGAVAPAQAEVVVMLSIDSSEGANFLTLGGPSSERKVAIPRAGVEDAVASFRKRLLAGSAALLCGGLALAAAIAHRATRPLRELSTAARAVGSGALGTQVPHAGSGEVSEAVLAFNGMSRRLAELDAESRSLREREHLTEIGEIARGLAHSLRNPLNALGLTVDEMAGDDPARREQAEAARRQIRRIDGAVRSFLALSATAASAPEEDVDLAALSQDVALEALQDARGRVSVGVQAPEGRVIVRGVTAELRALVQALVVNAVEASPDGGRVSVTVEAGGDGADGHAADGDSTDGDGRRGARLLVDDDGPGLPPSVRERLFTPHVTTKPSGSGMGLYLAHRIVTARHGGSLELVPREPSGTRAVATLPGTRA